MNRRGFLASLAAAFVVDPERLLWVPGAKLVSIPKPVVSLESVFVSEIWRKRGNGFWTKYLYEGQHYHAGKLLSEQLWPHERPPFVGMPNATEFKLARLMTPDNAQGLLKGAYDTGRGSFVRRLA